MPHQEQPPIASKFLDSRHEAHEKEVRELDEFLDEELSFSDMPFDLAGPEKIKLYQRYMRADFDLESWKAFRRELDPETYAVIEDAGAVTELPVHEQASVTRFIFNKLPRELQSRQLIALTKHLGVNDVGDIDELIDEVSASGEGMKKVAQLLLDAGQRRQQLLQKDFPDSRAPLFGIGFHASNSQILQDELHSKRRGSVESFETPEGWVDTTGNKFVSIDPADLYPGKYLYLTELNGGMKPVPGHEAWLASQGNIPVRKAVPLTPAVIDHFGLSFHENA
ncbi:MAG: hypothetical protein HY422_02625 [Candidatus Komeilibacteria bacterium]|nr:hypothetical protein [Candidatus Komeilibacteria bacterium]